MTDTTAPAEIGLAADFARPSHAQWVALVEEALKGASLEKRLVGRTSDGLRVEPLYPRKPGAHPVLRRASGTPWTIAARLDHPAADQASRLALEDLENGAGSLTVVLSGARTSRGFGLSQATAETLDAALAGVALDYIALHIEPADAGDAAAVAAFEEVFAARGHEASALAVDFGLDPIGEHAARGSVAGTFAPRAEAVASTAARLVRAGYRGSALSVDVRAYHEAGASEAQELAAALATGLAYLRLLEAAGLPPVRARRTLSFVIAVDADQFMGLAKLRALRRLWSRVETASSLAPEPIHIRAETAWRMVTRRDPWVNMLRSTMAVFTAGIGGADVVGVLPHTQALGLPDGFARRIARNTQSILIEESNLYRVADPAAGSGAYETLTEDLARAAWALFQDIEGRGGIVASLDTGHLPGLIATVRAGRQRDVATRKAPITGTSEFPLLAEQPVAVLEPMPENPAERHPAYAPSLPSVRLSEPFEALRDRADAALAENGARPRLFLASLGSIAEHTARSTWVRNTLAAGGIDSEVPDGFASVDEAVTAFRASGARGACIASSDAVYANLAVATATALKAAGAGPVVLAGRPGDLEQPLREAGVDVFLFAGQNMLDVLGDVQERLT
ncbi:MAG: methylmalonyl-CoA mutase family protein [Hyphomicrobiaceae bacterium]|nr:methylmalonyl-CoA mutase family protein [Hyphomicrobiaceae bacterium]